MARYIIIFTVAYLLALLVISRLELARNNSFGANSIIIIISVMTVKIVFSNREKREMLTDEYAKMVLASLLINYFMQMLPFIFYSQVRRVVYTKLPLLLGIFSFHLVLIVMGYLSTGLLNTWFHADSKGRP